MYTHPRLPALAGGMVLAAVVTACGGGGSSSGSPPEPPPPSPPPARIADTIVFNDLQGLRVIRDDGSGARTIDASNVDDFLISPTGYVAYSVQGGSRALWVAPLVGGGAPLRVSRNVDDPDGITWFDWSPDGSQLVYAAALDTPSAPGELVREIYVVGRDGTNERRINGPVGNPPVVELDFPDWSPDGEWILQQVFDLPTGSGSRTRRGLNLHDTRVAGPNSVRLVTHPFASSTPFQIGWSPDGTRLAYNRAQGATRDLLILDPAGVGQSVTVATGNRALQPAWRWSPDGARLAYLEQDPTRPGPRLRVATVGIGGPSTVVRDLAAEGSQIVNFLWSPDGSDLAYVAQTDEGSSLWIADRTGQRPDRRIGGALHDFSTRIAWSPDSARIAFVARLDPQFRRDDLFVAAVDGSSLVRIEQGLANFEAVSFAWSRDGQRLAFTVGTLRERNPLPEPAIALFSARPDGTDVRELARYSSPGNYEFAYR